MTTPTNLTYVFSERTISDLLQMIDRQRDIPEHQRPEMWKPDHQRQLIHTIMSGLPMQSILVREEIVDNNMKRWLEDGHQRFISIWKFFNNQLSWNDRFYRDFTEPEKLRYLTYRVAILTYRNATQGETTAIFDYFQNGVPLSAGQRFHARLETPLVRYARERLLMPDRHFYDRATRVWGAHPHSSDTKTKKWLMNALALAGGAAHGVSFITTSYEILGPELAKPFDVTQADRRIDQLIRTFELADEQSPIPARDRKKQWDAGKISGYILASYILYPERVTDLQDGWVRYLVSDRQNERGLVQLHFNMPKSRNWLPERWRIGYENIFVNPPPIEDASQASESEDEE